MDDGVKKQLAPPYVPFSTFQTALSYLRTHSVPTKVDKSTFPEMSGTARGQVLGAFEFLGLIDKENNPQPPLHGLAVDESERKKPLAEVLRQAYPTVFAIGLKNASPSQFNEAMSAFSVTGATLTRAKSFFLKAAQFAEIPLSSHLTRKTRARANGTPRKRKQKVVKTTEVEKPPSPPGSPDSGTDVKQIRLPQVGGQLTLSGTFNAFQLVGEERELIYQIVDLMTAYEEKTKEASA